MRGVWNGDQCQKYNTKVMIMNGTAKPKGMQRCIVLDGVPLEQVSRLKYLGSWITEDARSDEDIRARVEMAKAAFWQNKELMRRNIRLSTKIKSNQMSLPNVRFAVKTTSGTPPSITVSVHHPSR